MEHEHLRLSKFHLNIIKEMAKAAKKGFKEISDNELAELLGIDSRRFYVQLKLLKRKGIVNCKGKKRGHFMWALTKKGYECLAVYATDVVPKKTKIVKEVKHLGITTTKETLTISPLPSKVQTESEMSVGAGGSVNVLGSPIQVGLKQSDKKAIDFEGETSK